MQASIPRIENLLSAVMRAGRASLGAIVVCASLAAPSLAQSTAVSAAAPASVIAAASIPGAAASISRVASGGETLHIIVGHSFFLNTKFRLRKVYVADPAILSSVTLSPNQIIVTAVTSGVSSLILLDEQGQAQSYVVSSDTDVEGLRVAMSEAMRDDMVHVDGSGSRVILSGNVGSTALSDTAVKLASLYSKEVANSLIVVPPHAKQVRLKVRILEVDRTKLTQFGINIFNPVGNYTAASSTGQYASTATVTPSTGAGVASTLAVSNPLNFLLYDWKYNVGATIEDLETKNIAQILAEPTITAISGEKASFLAGGEFPFPIVQPGSAGTAASVSISFRQYGVKLDFTPTVNDDGTIRLKVAPEVSALDYANSVTIAGYTIPALSTRKADTEVELRSDQSFAISGLLDKRTTDSYNRTPGIASIPIIGELFKSKSQNHTNTELIVIVTPTLVDPVTEAATPNSPKFPTDNLNPNKFDKALPKKRDPQADLDAAQPVGAPIAQAAPAPAPPQTPAASPVVSSQPVATTAESTSVVQEVVSTPAPPAAPPTDPVSASVAVVPTDRSSVEVAPAPPTPSVQEVSAPASSSQMLAVALPAAPPIVEKAVAPAPIPESPSIVQIMTLSHKEDADTMVNALKRRGYDVAAKEDSQDSLIHLQVGPFANRTDAEAMRQRLLQEGYNATVK
jgi:pilus assembly protein CpaC